MILIEFARVRTGTITCPLFFVSWPKPGTLLLGSHKDRRCGDGSSISSFYHERNSLPWLPSKEIGFKNPNLRWGGTGGWLSQTKDLLPAKPEGAKGHLVSDNQAQHQRNGSYSNPTWNFITTTKTWKVLQNVIFVTGWTPWWEKLEISTKVSWALIDFNISMSGEIFGWSRPKYLARDN